MKRLSDIELKSLRPEMVVVSMIFGSSFLIVFLVALVHAPSLLLTLYDSFHEAVFFIQGGFSHSLASVSESSGGLEQILVDVGTGVLLLFEHF